MYFKHFPNIAYPSQEQLVVIQDIIIRLGFSSKAKNTNDLFADYIIKEGQTPESIAESVYGDSRYYWVVMLFNDAQDPQYDFPLRSTSLDNYIYKKYPSKTLFLSPVGISQEFFSHPLGATSTVRNFSEGDTITIFLSHNNYKDTGKDKVIGVIKKLIPELSAIQLETLQGEIREGDIIARGYDGEIKAEVRKVIDSRYALRHFADMNSNRLNPIATPPDSNGDQVPLGQTGEGFAVDLVGTTQTILENYINEDNTEYVVTNETHEFVKNTEHRKIRLLDPRYLENITRELTEILK